MLRIILRPALLGAIFGTALLLAPPVAAQSATRRTAAPATKKAQTGAARPAAPEAAAGTFQLVRLTEKRTIAITSEALAEIERRRQQTEEVSWVVSPYATIRILPRRVITAPGFVPVEPVVNAY